MIDARILVVEDEQRLAEVLQKQLNESGFRADVANDGYVGKRMMEQADYDLVILDINIPLINGYELCCEIRKTNRNTPIIMLTALGTPENKLIGFESGADDYVLKPFDFRELLARINVFLKRSNVTIVPNRKLIIADLEMDLDSKTVIRAGKKIELTSKEFALMETLLINKNKVLYSDKIQDLKNIGFSRSSHSDNPEYFSVGKKDGVLYNHRINNQLYHVYVSAYDKYFLLLFKNSDQPYFGYSNQSKGDQLIEVKQPVG